MNQLILNRLSALTLISYAAVLLVLLLRPLVRRLGGAGLVYASWLLVPLVLLASALPQPVEMTLPAAAAPMQWVITNAGTLPELPAERADLWVTLWLVGVLIAALIFAAQQLRFQQRLGRLQPLGDGVQHLASGNFTGALLIGLLRPKIVLPADFFRRYSALEQTLILAHEKVHLQRRDAAVNLLVSAFQTLFWFNPLLHFAAGRVRLDQELACDAAVLEKHPDSRSHYAGAILKSALIESSAPLACHWQSRHPLKERILELTRTPPERARRIAARALLSALALGACYTAWATSDGVAPSPEATASAVKQQPEGTDLYKVQFSMLMFEQVSDGKTTRRTADFAIAVRPGETGLVKFMEAPDQCTLNLTLTPQADQMVFIELPLTCNGESSSPRMLTHLGAKTSIKIGNATKFTQVSVVVTQ